MRIRFMVGLCGLFGLAAVLPSAAEADPLDLEKYLDMERVQNVELSPNGSTVLYARRWIDKINDNYKTALWVMNVDGSRNRELVKNAGAARWSPDGTRIAYVSKDDNGKAQLFVRWMDSEGATSQITHWDKPIKAYRWAPNGKSLALIATVTPSPEWAVDIPFKPEGAKWTDEPLILDRAHYRLDRVGLTPGFDHLFVVPADGGTPRQITSGKWNVGARNFNIPVSQAIEWTKDSKTILFDGLTTEAEVLYQQASNINSVNVETGEISRLTKEDGFWYGPKLSTDERVMAFSGHEVSKLTSPGQNIFMSTINGDNFKKITHGIANSPDLKGWSRDGTGLYFQMGAEGAQNLYFATLKGRVVPITKGQHILNVSSINASGDVVGTRTSPKKPLDAFYFNIKTPNVIRQLTRVNDDVLTGVDLADVEEIWYTSSDDTRVQGWIVKPPQFDTSKKYPLILKIHGGPHMMYDVRFRYDMQENAAKGYVVLYTNPRGSTGYGDNFANAINNAYPGRADFDDLMNGVDEVLSRGYIDSQRMYVTGCSGGGVLTSWVVSHTDRFKAAAALCPVINWISFAGTADIIGWAYNRFDGYYWDDPTKWLEHSPLMHVNKVKTPTLLMTGLKDLRTPIDQAEEFYSALKMLGVPTKLIGVHGEYHGTSSIPSNFIRTQLILRKWFEEHGGEAGPR